MKTRAARTNTMTLGPFLTLILNSRPHTESSSEAPFKGGGGMRISPIATLQPDKRTAETQTIGIRRRTLGPFVSLILRQLEKKTAELRFAAERNHPRQALCVRVHVG